MKIYNITNQVQSITVFDRSNGRYLDINVCAKSSTDIDKTLLLTSDLDPNIWYYEGMRNNTEKDLSKTLLNTTEKLQEIKDEYTDEDDFCEDCVIHVEEEVTEANESFICEICGAEYTSSRGLANHKSRSHK